MACCDMLLIGLLASMINPTTPPKLTDYFSIPGVFDFNAIQDKLTPGPTVLGMSVISAMLHDILEIVSQNDEKDLQSWHPDGYDFWTVGFGSGPRFIRSLGLQYWSLWIAKVCGI
ncbi:Multicopper oxidase, C-terminal [Dillenia turbinata]|uniref:Multicopper oxidase, C-terminal n=1 Tax=Dillenia turbinata TaxID=194707 RepID=A0AAN8V5B6_9MAGN